MGAMLDGTSVGAVLDSMCHAAGLSAGQDSRIRAMLLGYLLGRTVG